MLRKLLLLLIDDTPNLATRNLDALSTILEGLVAARGIPRDRHSPRVEEQGEYISIQKEAVSDTMPTLPPIAIGQRSSHVRDGSAASDEPSPSQRVIAAARPGTTDAAKARAAYPLKKRLEADIGRAQLDQEHFGDWLTKSLKGHKFVDPPKDAIQEARETGKQVDGLLKEVSNFAKEKEASASIEIAALNSIDPNTTKMALEEFKSVVFAVTGVQISRRPVGSELIAKDLWR
jgi:hypothetical protein